MKRCPKCKEIKQDSEFRPSSTTGRLQAYCTPCHRAYYAAYTKANPGKGAERNRRHRQKHWDEVKLAQYEWRRTHPDEWKAICQRWQYKNRKAYEAKRREQVRREVFEAYGGFVCACCGETEPLFLTIDHVNNDGADHRRELAGKGGSAFFTWVKRHNFPAGFQVLCRNCNWGKHANGGICPHHDLEGSTTRAAARSSEAIAERSARGPYLHEGCEIVFSA